MHVIAISYIIQSEENRIYRVNIKGNVKQQSLNSKTMLAESFAKDGDLMTD